MMIFSEKRRKLLKRIYRGIGATAIALVFQACYGMPLVTARPDSDDILICGVVRSKSTNVPVPEIKVSIKDLNTHGYTDKNGNFYIYVPRQDSYKIKFEDVDGPKNGSFKLQKTKIALMDAIDPLKIYLDEVELVPNSVSFGTGS